MATTAAFKATTITNEPETAAPAKQKSRWSAGVTPYKEMGYYEPDYQPKDTDILCAFRLVPQ